MPEPDLDEPESPFAASGSFPTGSLNGARLLRQLARIFEPFFSTKRVGVGSGLGLSICRSILSEFGGSIAVESVPGEGASFVIRLPAYVEEESAWRSLSDRVVQLEAPRGRVLLVDDEDPLRRAMARLLPEHVVVSAVSGKQAQSILEHDQDFDVILCDLMMPEMTGVELHQWLIEHNPTLAKRIVFVTVGAFGHVDAEYLTECGNPRLEKPFSNNAFIRLVSERVRAVQAESPRRARES